MRAARGPHQSGSPAAISHSGTSGVTCVTHSQTRVALQRLRDLAPDVVASFHDVPEEVAE